MESWLGPGALAREFPDEIRARNHSFIRPVLHNWRLLPLLGGRPSLRLSFSGSCAQLAQPKLWWLGTRVRKSCWYEGQRPQFAAGIPVPARVKSSELRRHRSA